MLTGLLLGLWLMMAIGRDTPVGRLLHRTMVELPCRKLAAISRGQILLAVLTLAVIAALVWFLADDGRMLVTFGMPEFLAFAGAIDLSALLDLAAVAVIAAGTVRLRAVRAWLAHRFPGAARPRARSVRARRLARPANDDEDRPAAALAA